MFNLYTKLTFMYYLVTIKVKEHKLKILMPNKHIKLKKGK